MKAVEIAKKRRPKVKLWYKFHTDVNELFYNGDDQQLERDAQCRCGENYIFLSQKDNNPELYTYISLLCKCGSYIKMKFPVG